MRFSIALSVLFISSTAYGDVVANNLAEQGYVSTGWATSVGYSNPRLGFTKEGAGQEFTSTKTGLLTSISATVDKFIGGQDLIVSLYTANQGVPSLFVGSVRVPETEFSGSINTFDFSGLNILLIENQSYVVTFTVDSPVGLTTSYRALLTETNENSFGVRSLFSRDSINWEPSNVYPEIGLIVEADPIAPPPQEVLVDILASKINLKTKNPKPLEVAVLGSEELDVTQIDNSSILLGDPVLTDPEFGTGVSVAPVSGTYSDVNGDGIFDLVATFDLNEMKALGAIDSSSTELLLEAELANGGIVYGSDTLSFPGKGNGKGKNK